jgi:pyruvate/2-oxoglutarate dehydrogenase complex dihydrolipoamide acyltransferase (E2) component
MPNLELSFSAEELGADKGLLVKWEKELGDWVRKHEVVAICQANDREISLKAPVQGVLQKILVEANADFDSGTVLGILRTVMGGT